METKRLTVLNYVMKLEKLSENASHDIMNDDSATEYSQSVKEQMESFCGTMTVKRRHVQKEVTAAAQEEEDLNDRVPEA